MDPADRIAAYRADELDADQRRRFEDDLERDADLAAQLDAARRADAALARQTPTPLPDGAYERLLATLRPELDASLAGTGASRAVPADDEPASEATGTTSAASHPRDELATRRTRRQVPWTAIGTAVAAVVAVAVVAVGPLGLGSGGGDDGVRTTSGDATAGDAGGEAMMESAPADEQALADPVLRASGRELDEADADALLDDPQARQLAEAGLDPAAAAELSRAYAAAFGASPGPDAATDDAADADEAAPDQPTEETETEDSEAASRTEEFADASRASLRTEGEVDPEVRERVGRCLEQLLAGGGTPVVVAAETVTFDGEAAVAFTLVGEDGSGAARRPEVWVLARDDCAVRYFTQR